MPRAAGQTIPKYRKHRATGQAVCTLNDWDHYLGPYGTQASRIEYDRLVGEWLQRGRYPVGGSHSEITVVELAARYLAFAKTYYRRDGRPAGPRDVCVGGGLDA